MIAERLTLVTDFSSLKAGDLVVGKPCDYCEEIHRGLLLRLVPSSLWHEVHDVWATTGRAHGIAFVISRSSVAAGRVYLVDAGLEQTETTEKAETRPLETVR